MVMSRTDQQITEKESPVTPPGGSTATGHTVPRTVSTVIARRPLELHIVVVSQHQGES